MINENLNYFIPREYTKEGKIEYTRPHTGDPMNLGKIEYIQKLIPNDNHLKDGDPFCQVFNTGYRVATENLEYKNWMGLTFSDIDSKYYYTFNKPFNVNRLLNAIKDTAPYLFNYNFYGVQLTNSKTSFRIWWYWECERTEENFIKCCILSDKYSKELFYSFGKDGQEIIDYTTGGHRVLDRCSKSIMQGFYLTRNELFLNEFRYCDDYGSCHLDDINIEDVYKTSDVIKFECDGLQNDNVSFKCKHDINKDELRYFPHQHRRCIYEALIVLFNDRKIVDDEWKYISTLLPETDGIVAGHSSEFFMNEPNKNRWFDRFNAKTYHDLSWLRNFGYEYDDRYEYIYQSKFEKSWRKYCNNVIQSIIVEKEVDNFIENNKKASKADIALFRNSQYEQLKDISIFDKYYDEHIDGEDKQKLADIRNSYYKKRWKPYEFKHLTNGYKIPNDSITYQMYADFHYRDSNNLPTIKYNILEDNILTHGFWYETKKTQYHTLKFNDEYVYWKNNDTFSNMTSRSDMTYAISSYASRYHGFHSIKDYLNSLDLNLANEELLETWAIRYFNADDNELTRTISKNFFIGAVKKMFVEDPTTFVFQHMLFLQGPTGCGKTFFLVNMFTINGHSYILNNIDPNGKDNEIGPMIGKNWLIQFGESDKLKKASVESVKEFMDRINLGFKFQKKYENEQTTLYPRVVACRTSNDSVLFNDVSINEGDRRNWLIVCKTPACSCGDELKELMMSEKDILWATAMKLYLDNPDRSLELPVHLFKALNELQEEFKLIKTDDTKELYDEIFDRKFIVNYKKHIQDEYSFIEMMKRADSYLDSYSLSTVQTDKRTIDDIFDGKTNYDSNLYDIKDYINCIPIKWVSNYVKKNYGVNQLTLLTNYMKEIGWEYNKSIRYNGKVMKCWSKS